MTELRPHLRIEPDEPGEGLFEGAHESLDVTVPTLDDVERTWRTHWLPLLSEGGRISIEKLKAELYDSWHLVNEARRVYRHVTEGVTDDLTASADGIIAMAERRLTERIYPLHARIRELEGEIRAFVKAGQDA